MQPLLSLSADTLLNKFGSGKHAPGSGSAAALIGLLAAKLVVTVGQLTLAKVKYKKHHRAVEVSSARIQSVLIPALAHLFQEDAEAFDKVIDARRARDKATDEYLRRKHAEDALHQLKLATAIPFKIAEACLELIDHSSNIFDVGFEGARGDTGVALSASVAGVLSAVFVINLNLKSFRGSYWARQRRKECDQLQLIAVEKYQSALSRVVQLRAEDLTSLQKINETDPIANLWSRSKKNYTNEEISDRASAVQKIIWDSRSDIWADEGIPTDPVELLNPESALRRLGYSYYVADTLGTFATDEGTFEVAGLLEALLGRVSISGQMKPEVRLFTAAHELGHVVLHPHLKEAHRDMPLDGSSTSRKKIERDADKFASDYLMPTNLVRNRFASIFGTNHFFLSEETSFALYGISLIEAKRRIRSIRTLSRLLASTKSFNGQQIVSIANQFHVSIEAMAIRLEELELLSL
jgi:formiminotetrahydrofolate cyclodeaminase/Zn-dependent peptidase ImmA (M78 family)